MSKFKVGDVCVVIEHPTMTAADRKYIGRECTIVGPPVLIRRWPAYTVTGLDPLWPSDCTEHCLRLKRPPDHPDTKSTWDACPWRPGVSHPIAELVRRDLAEFVT